MTKFIFQIIILLSAIFFVGCIKDYEDKMIPNVSSSHLAEISFIMIADGCGNVYTIKNAAEIPGKVLEIIDNHVDENTELVFLIDNTGSMDNDIDAVQLALDNIISKLPAGMRLATATYGDKLYDSDWFTYIDFTSDFDLVKNFINNIPIYGGGDSPESVYDGLYETIVKLDWSSDKNKVIILIGDAPDNERGRTLEQVKAKADELKINANFYPILVKGII